MFELLLFGVIIFLVIVLFFILSKFFSLKEELASIQYLKRSQSVKYGQLTEQWIPFSTKYPFDSQNFRFIGNPIDGVSFEEDKIVFVEFKTNLSRLSDSQKKIRDLVLDKKIEWLELRIK